MLFFAEMQGCLQVQRMQEEISQERMNAFMRKITSFFISLCLIVSIFAGAGVSAGAAGETYTFGINGTFDYSEANEVLQKLNHLRRQMSLPELILDEQLMSAAMQRAAEISIYFSHTRPSGETCFTALPSGYTSAAENIAIGQTDAARVMEGWVNSTGHFANMISSTKTAVGIGCFYQSDGTKSWVQLFTGGMATRPVTASGKRTETRNVTAIADYLTLGLKPENAILEAGKTETFALYNIVNEGWNQANATKIIAKFYETSDSKIATVNSAGTVTGISAGGTVLRLGVGNDLYAQANIIVTGSAQNNEITPSMFVVDTTTSRHTGVAIEKTIITDLVRNTDYTVTYANNINVGTATLTINGTGLYSGTLTYRFTIDNLSDPGNKIVPVGTASSSGEISYGQQLSVLGLSATMFDNGNAVAGSVNWQTSSTLPAAGSAFHTWIFTPTDGTTYASARGSIQVDVKKTTPVGTPGYTEITAEGKTLADVALSGNFKNPYSESQILGRISWDDASTTTVAMDEEYGWTFTPNDLDNYNKVTGKTVPFAVDEKIALVGTSNGTLGVSTTSPASGANVTVTVDPAEGYKFENLKITDINGKNITYMQIGVNRYSFVFEGVKVTVSAAFLPKYPSESEIPFTDVKTSDWFYDSAKFVYENKLFGGTSSSAFSPDVVMSRGMMVTVLHRLAGTPAGIGNAFTDVPANSWYTDAVSWAASKNIVSGIGNNLFAPDNNITREQMAVMLVNYAKTMNINLPTVRGTVVFSDSNQISSWAREAVDVMYRAGIINGKGGNTFDPGGNAIRAEVATMFMNFLKAI